MNRVTILVVDDEESQLHTLSGYLSKQGYTVFEADCGEKAFELVEREQVDLVLTDMRMPGLTGMELLQKIHSLNPEIDVILMTAFSQVDEAVATMKLNARDYLQKPIDLDQLDFIIEKALERRNLISENRELRQALQEKYDFKTIISGSGAMDQVLNTAARAAQSKATVLLRGESGTGKEVIARAIHLAGERGAMSFIPVNVAAVADTLIESELFGYEKGAFTGAERQKPGCFELADGGTLFIDEVGDIPLASQVKMLRVLQDHSFQRVGGEKTLQVDVRVIAATNQDLEKLIKENRFREDLYYRLNVICIRIPPLRERRSDISLLIDHFIQKFSKEENKRINAVSKEAMDLLMKYHYPGNVRELENIIQRAVVLTRTETISKVDLPPFLNNQEGETNLSPTSDLPLLQQVARLEKSAIQAALRQADGNQSAAARSLGLTERNLRYKMKKYGLK